MIQHFHAKGVFAEFVPFLLQFAIGMHAALKADEDAVLHGSKVVCGLYVHLVVPFAAQHEEAHFRPCLFV